MGRIFETRKATMFKRYAKMAKAFTKIGREIVIAVKTGGPHPESNPRLRMIMQNAKAVNMPKANVEAAKVRVWNATEKENLALITSISKLESKATVLDSYFW